MRDERYKILGIAGSLRRDSYNRGLLRTAREVAPPHVTIETFDLDPIPPFNSDVEAAGDPVPVWRLKEAIGEADALLIATPEYNYSIPGVLKNALDWAARPPMASVLRHKPVALMGASPAHSGTVRAQLALRQVFVFTESHVLLKPELTISDADKLFDADGRVVDEATRERVRRLVEALVAWTGRIQVAGLGARA